MKEKLGTCHTYPTQHLLQSLRGCNCLSHFPASNTDSHLRHNVLNTMHRKMVEQIEREIQCLTMSTLCQACLYHSQGVIAWLLVSCFLLHNPICRSSVHRCRASNLNVLGQNAISFPFACFFCCSRNAIWF